jgi:hypothetical protein
MVFSHDQGIAGQPGFLQPAEQPADLVVQRRHVVAVRARL